MKQTNNKIGWTHLPWWMKMVVVFGWIDIVLFGIGFVMGFFGLI